MRALWRAEGCLRGTPAAFLCPPSVRISRREGGRRTVPSPPVHEVAIYPSRGSWGVKGSSYTARCDGRGSVIYTTPGSLNIPGIKV